MIENWIDALSNVWAGITDERFGSVKSYLLIERAEFPSTIDPVQLDLHPVALTIPLDMTPTYSLSLKETFYSGTTQFHVCPDNAMSRVPELMPWFGKILRACAANIKLGGAVHNFLVERIEGPIELQYGNEAVHWGFVVYWTVKENPLADLVVSA